MKEGSKAKARYDSTGLTFVPTDMSVSDYLDYFYKVYVMSELKPISQEFLYECRKKGYARPTLIHLRNNMKEPFNYAINPCGFIEDNPVAKTSLPKTSKEQVNPHHLISLEDYHTIMKYFHFGNRYHVMLQLGWNLGLRLGEITGLRWSDIDFEKRNVRFEKQAIYCNKIPERKSNFYIETFKTENSIRTVSFGESLKTLLLKERKRQKENESNYGIYYTKQYLVEVSS